MLVDEGDLEVVFGEWLAWELADEVVRDASGGWCGVDVPEPVDEHHRAFVGKVSADGGSGASGGESPIAVGDRVLYLTASVFALADGEAEHFLAALSTLDTGCEWAEAGLEYQFLEVLEPRQFSDGSLGLLVRTKTPTAVTKTELYWVQRGTTLAMIGIVPALDQPAVPDAILARMDSRLGQVAG